jgi:hypothetical protein
MKKTLHFIVEWFVWLFSIAFFFLLVVGIGLITNYGWQYVFAQKQVLPSFISGDIVNSVETTLCKKSYKWLYTELLQKRVEYQENILSRIEHYKKINNEICDQREVFVKSVGEIMPVSEVIELFVSGKEIPLKLLPAHSAYKFLTQKIKIKKQTEDWINEQERLNLLGDIEQQMMSVKNHIDNEKTMDNKLLEDLERLIATPIKGITQDIIGDRDAVEELHDTFVPELERDTKVIFIKRN